MTIVVDIKKRRKLYPITFFKNPQYSRDSWRGKIIPVTLLFIFFIKNRNVGMLNVFEMNGDF